jgi:hypothetical protein
MYTIQGKTWPTYHTLSTLGPRMALNHTCFMWSVYSKPFTSHQQGWTDALLTRKSAPDSTSQPGWVAHGTRLSFSPNTTIEAVRLSQAPIDGRLLGLLGPYHQHAIRIFNTCSWGLTHRSLTDIGGGYNLKGASLPYHTPRPSQPMVLHFPPKGSTWSQVIHPTITNWSKEGTNPKSPEWEPPLDFYRNLTSKQSVS